MRALKQPRYHHAVLRRSFHRASLFAAFLATCGLLTVIAAQPGERLILSRLAPTHTGLFIASPLGEHEQPLLPTTGRDYNPSFSPDGQWVVFTSDRNGSADLYRVHRDGTGLDRLTDDSAFDDQGALSPDGNTLAFVSSRDVGTANVWLMDLATRRSRNVTKHASGNYRPSWSPDGRWIAFTSDREGPHRRMVIPGCCGWELMQFTALYIVRPDGSDLRRLTAAGGSVASPKWDPSGRRIVVAESRDGLAAARIVAVDIETRDRVVVAEGADRKLSPQFLDAATTAYLSLSRDGARLVTTREAGPLSQYTNPAWSPDGTQVVFSRTLAQASRAPLPVVPLSSRTQPELYLTGTDPFSARYSADGQQLIVARNVAQDHWLEVMRADGTALRRVYTSTEDTLLGTVAWSLDGRRVAFTIGRLASRNPVSPSQIGMVDIDGTNFRQVTAGEDSSAFPSFSPDGRRLVYRVLGKAQGLRVMSLDGTDNRTLSAGWDNFPAWSPRADRVVFAGRVGDDFEIFTVRPDGKDRRQLTHDRGNNSHPVWSPDGQSIAFTSSRTGWKDEVLLAAQGAQTYGELEVMRADGTRRRRLTDNQWEEAPSAWLPALVK